MFFFASSLGLIVGDNVGGKETPICIHSFAFLSGTRTEEIYIYIYKAQIF